MRVCVMIDRMLTYSLVSPVSGLVACWFGSEREAVAYAESQGWEVF